MAAKVEPEKAKGYQFPPAKVAYNRRDLLLYANSIGAYDLKFAYENTPGFAAFPTYPVVLALKGESYDVVPFGVPNPKKKQTGGIGGGIPGVPKYDPNMILHGEQSIEILKTLPLEGEFDLKGTILGVYDKGKGMLIQQQSVMVDSKGVEYAKLISGTFVRGLGGFGGEKQPPEKSYTPPNRAPDAIGEFATSPFQASLYRLSGDYNPLHIDPSIAKKVGFPGPILHGLCTFGIAAQTILKSVLNNDATRFKAIRVRFASPVFPGETLVTEMWKEGNDIIFQTKVKERNIVVISNAVLETQPASSKL
jgi:peroxisomal enoyl-CoA hydratase 2